MAEKTQRLPKKSILKSPSKEQTADKADPKRREEIENSVRSRFEAEKRAQQTVIAMIDGAVSKEILQGAAKFIDPSHYADIGEERSIEKLCGYPLCAHAIQILPQRYKINTSTNQVFDISDRKNFCSNHCYAASLLYEKQLSRTPVWLREGEIMDEVKVVLPEEIKGAQGVAVPLTDENTGLLNEMMALNLETNNEPEN